MKKLITLLVAVTAMLTCFAQSTDFGDFKLAPHKLFIHSDIDISDFRDFERTTIKGTGIDNAVEFETWGEVFPILAPDATPAGWVMQTGNPAAHQSTDAYVGTYAMHVETAIMGEELSAGIAVLGEVNLSFSPFGLVMTQGEAFDLRPLTFGFAIKGNLLAQDTAVVVLQLMKEGALVGVSGGLLGATEVGSDYAFYQMPVQYQNQLTPDTAMIIVTSGAVGIFSDGDFGTLTAGSYVVVDNIVLDYGTTDITNSTKESVMIFPNPASDFITIENAENSELIVLNMLGETVIRVENASASQNIDTSKLVAGTYFVKIGDNLHKFNVVK